MRVRLLACASALALLPVLAAAPSLAQTTTGHPPATPQRFAPGGSAGMGNIAPSGDMTWHPPGAGARGAESAADTAPGSAGSTGVGPTGMLTAPGADTTAREVAQDNTKAAAGNGAEPGQAPAGSGQSTSSQSTSGQSGSGQSSSDQSSAGQSGSSQRSADQGSQSQSAQSGTNPQSGSEPKSGSGQSSSSQSSSSQSGQSQSTQSGTSSGQNQSSQSQSAQNPGTQSQQSQSAQGQSPPSQQIEQRTDQRISELRKQLQITQAEEPKWQAFAQAMKKNAQELAQFWQENGSRIRQMNAVEGLQFYTQMTQLYAQGAERLVQPFQALYQSMPKHQQELADRVFQQVRAQAAARRRGAQPSNASQQGSGTQSSGMQH